MQDNAIKRLTMREFLRVSAAEITETPGMVAETRANGPNFRGFV